MRILTVFVLSAALASSAAAQRAASGAVGHAFAPASRAPQNLAVDRGAYGGRFGRHSPYGTLLFPYFTDSLALDDLYASGYPVASQPPMIPLPEALALLHSRNREDAADVDRPAAPTEPLMIELQGDHYVRVNNAAANGEALPISLAQDAQPGKQSRTTTSAADAVQSASGPVSSARPRTHELSPAVLVFRDGHSEEVRDYTIADGILYARGDFYTDGYWSKKIDLSTLDLAQTLQANASRNVSFVLPSSPNEVITRF